MSKHGILADERSAGYREGFGQASVLSRDDAHEEGRIAAYTEMAGSNRRWWLFGVLCGASITFLVGAIV